MDERGPSETAETQATRVSAHTREGQMREELPPKLAYAMFDTDPESLLKDPQDRESEIRQVTILHTSYARGLIEPAEDRSCPT